MIISVNTRPAMDDFKKLMSRTDAILNKDAQIRPDYYRKRVGKLLEDDVFDALCKTAKGTPFEGTLKKISGQKFPDIVVGKYYGVEVKSTKLNHWTSTGGSILETTRIDNIERIYLTFGKLGGEKVEFLSKPYEECLSGIAVTHMPRYLIDMKLQKDNTIFDKLCISYDELRTMDNPIEIVSNYYRSELKPGESLWWLSDVADESISPKVRLWTSLSKQEKEELIVKGYVLFPEILGKSSNVKYNNYALWLVIQQGIVNTNIRDAFSAGGKVNMITVDGTRIKMPAVFGGIKKYREHIVEMINKIEVSVLEEYWEQTVQDNRLKQWCDIVSDLVNQYLEIQYLTVQDFLYEIFEIEY